MNWLLHRMLKVDFGICSQNIEWDGGQMIWKDTVAEPGLKIWRLASREPDFKQAFITEVVNAHFQGLMYVDCFGEASLLFWYIVESNNVYKLW